MSLLLSLNNLEITKGSKLLFENLNFGIFEGEKIGLIGPNGAGKSTLLRLIAGEESPDAGDVSVRKNVKIAFVSQQTDFNSDHSIQKVIVEYLQTLGVSASDAEVQAAMYLNQSEFDSPDLHVSTLSGGWKKRLAIVRAIASEPDLLILDEPTNHMDWDGILWLENWLKTFKKSLLLVSHDRTFLNNVTNRTIEINRLYRDGYLSFNCNYQDFLVQKDQYIQTQLSLQDTLSNKARREVEWLRAGVKARTTKSSARMKEAYDLLENLDRVKERNRAAQARSRVEIDSTGRKAKKLIELNDVTIGFENKNLINNLNLTLGSKTCLGLLGKNGSGKSTLLKAIIGESTHYSGEVFRAEQLKIVYFDQTRQQLPQDISLIEYLGEGGEYAIFKDQSIHVASYASRFLFSSDKMQLKISQLSGGEQARLLIAKLLLQPADVLILDEPTNDLDIETIEILEDTLSSFEGLIILVSHDRTFLSQVCHKFLALEGHGRWTIYAEIEQWLRETQSAAPIKRDAPAVKKDETPKSVSTKVKLSYKEKRQLETIEADILQAEEELEKAQNEMQLPEVLADHQKLSEVSLKVTNCQQRVDELYALWSELEAKSLKQ